MLINNNEIPLYTQIGKYLVLKSENAKYGLNYRLLLCWREYELIKPIWKFLEKLKYAYLWSSFSIWTKYYDHILKLHFIWLECNPKEIGMECLEPWNLKSN